MGGGWSRGGEEEEEEYIYRQRGMKEE